MYTLFFSVSHGTFRCGVLLNIYDNSSFIESQFSHVLLFCVVFSKRYLFCCLWCVWSFFSLLHPAVFDSASAFNQDVSNWNTGAVTDMRYSKCTLSPSLWPRLPLLCFEYTTSRGSSGHNSHTYFVLLCCVFETVPCCCCLWWVGLFLFFVAPSFAVFESASVFNQDVSKWNTGAVTTIDGSKCTLSPSLWPRLPLLCFEYTTTRISSDHNSHTFCSFVLCF